MNSVTNNLLLISNQIHHSVDSFRVETLKDGSEVIKKNDFIRRFLFYPIYSRNSHRDKLEQLIKKNVQLASQFGRECFVEEKTREVTDLFLAVQKYNQTIATLNVQMHRFPFSLANRVKLDLVNHAYVPEINPVKVLKIEEGEIPPDLQNDKPEIVKEKRFFKEYQIRHYPGDRIDHSNEAKHIFLSTQKERVLSLIGRICEAVARLFKFNMTTFQKYHYRKNNETDEQIYAPRISPFNLSQEPTSYWLGHATLFLSVPLKSKNGTLSSFTLITDPVEGNLQAFLYPRQTKCARSIEETPAPDIYLLSHNHLDHYSEETVKKIFAQQPIMLVPKGDKERYAKLAKKLGFSDEKIFELDWWQKKEIAFEKNGEHYHMQITATPARHWSGQGPCGGHESTFLGYIIQGNEKGDIYFAGDTARLNDDHIAKLKNHFNIKWSFQPGGPDEMRKEMESTHQASVDGLSVHFKTMISKIYLQGMDKNAFMILACDLKTIYMHTMTFKLGNLHISDTKESVRKVLSALSSYKETNQKIALINLKVRVHNLDLQYQNLPAEKLKAKIANSEMKMRNRLCEEELNLKPYEREVFHELCHLANGLVFSNGETLLPDEMAAILRGTVIVPKIGSRLSLTTHNLNQLESSF